MDCSRKSSQRQGRRAKGRIFLEPMENCIADRKQDLASIGARKFLLNDLDTELSRLIPSLADRIATLASGDSVGKSDKVLLLIEDDFFWERERSPAARLIREAIGLECLEVHFVPKQFIVKTSSGEISRDKTLEAWQACQSKAENGWASLEQVNFAHRLAEQFPGIRSDRPVQEELDSRGRLLLRLVCEECGIQYDPDLTLERLAASGEKEGKPSRSQVFSIVALVDGSRLGIGAPSPIIDDSFLHAIASEVGMPVHFEHICVPPAPILLSDLIVHDYFFPKNPDAAYGPLSALLRKIKEASLILIDDEDNFRTPPYCSYPALNRQLTTHPNAELLGHRLQRYTRNHHLLPRRVVLGREITPESINPALQHMESYLGVPMLKMAFHTQFRPHTENWDFCDYREFSTDAEKLTNRAWVERFREALLGFIRQRAGQFHKPEGVPENRFVLFDSPHFCSFLLNPAAVDFVVRQYNSFCIIGPPSSLPYLRQQLDMLGKRYFFSSRVPPTDVDYECLILSGGIGGRLPATNKPTFDFVHAREEGQGGGRPHNVPADIDALCPPLAACNESLFQSLRMKYGVLIGNYLLNRTVMQTVPQPQP
jgi:hypothetical protein